VCLLSLGHVACSNTTSIGLHLLMTLVVVLLLLMMLMLLLWC
jgi:hypothetical protein